MIYQPDELHIHLCLGKSMCDKSKHKQALANNKFSIRSSGCRMSTVLLIQG